MDKAAKKRADIVKRAIANQGLEGLVVSAESRKIADQYIAGAITATAAAKKIKTFYTNSMSAQ